MAPPLNELEAATAPPEPNRVDMLDDELEPIGRPSRLSEDLGSTLGIAEPGD